MKKYILVKSIPLLLLLVFLGAGCVTFEGEIPVEGDFSDTIYISPKNQDRIQDSVNIPLNIPPREGLKVAGFYLTIKDSTNVIVYSLGQLQDQENSNPTAQKNLVLPSAIIWDGRNKDGNWVADDEYTLLAKVWDKKGN